MCLYCVCVCINVFCFRRVRFINTTLDALNKYIFPRVPPTLLTASNSWNEITRTFLPADCHGLLKSLFAAFANGDRNEPAIANVQPILAKMISEFLELEKCSNKIFLSAVCAVFCKYRRVTVSINRQHRCRCNRRTLSAEQETSGSFAKTTKF